MIDSAKKKVSIWLFIDPGVDINRSHVTACAVMNNNMAQKTNKHDRLFIKKPRLISRNQDKKNLERDTGRERVPTGAPGFPGTERGGMLGLVPGGGRVAAGVRTGLGAAGGAMAGITVGVGDVFKRFNASLLK